MYWWSAPSLLKGSATLPKLVKTIYQRRVAVLLVLAGDQKPHQLVDLAVGATRDAQLEEEDIDAEVQQVSEARNDHRR